MTTCTVPRISPFDVRHGELIRSLGALQKRARAGMKAKGWSQYDTAAELDISQAAVNAALNDKKGTRVGTVIRIIEVTTNYTVTPEHTVEYRVERKDRDS